MERVLGTFFSAMTAGVFLSIPQQAYSFSLGIRPAAGLDILTIPGVRISSLEDGSALTAEQQLARNFVYFGADVMVTPFEKGALSISALLGFRASSAKTAGAVMSDALSLSYIPIGASVDFALQKFRASVFAAYDLGMSPKLTLTESETKIETPVPLTGLSRLHFGAAGEFFVLPSLSLFAEGGFVTGSYTNADAPITLTLGSGADATKVESKVVGGTNKISGFTVGGGLSYYIPAPASQRGAVKAETKPPPKKGSKPAPKKAKPKPSPSEGEG